MQSPKIKSSPVDLENLTIQSDVGEIKLIIVRPKGKKDNLPVILFTHGAGWVLGSVNTHDHLIRELSAGVDAALVFVDYPLAPEAPFPVAIMQSYETLKYIADHGKYHGFNVSKLAIVGDSVGGNMAIAVTILAKEKKGPKINFQVLFYPVTSSELTTKSYEEFKEGYWLAKDSMKWFWDNYEPNSGKRKEYLLSPLNADLELLHGLPPALIITDENDVLRDEGEAYAHKLMQADVEVTAFRMLGTIHDFVMLNALAETPAARGAINIATLFLRNAFSKIN